MDLKQIQNAIEKLVDNVVHQIATNKSTRLEDPSRFDKEGLEPFMKDFWSDSFKSAVTDTVYAAVMDEIHPTPVDDVQEEGYDPVVASIVKFLGH